MFFLASDQHFGTNIFKGAIEVKFLLYFLLYFLFSSLSCNSIVITFVHYIDYPSSAYVQSLPLWLCLHA